MAVKPVGSSCQAVVCEDGRVVGSSCKDLDDRGMALVYRRWGKRRETVVTADDEVIW